MESAFVDVIPECNSMINESLVLLTDRFPGVVR